MADYRIIYPEAIRRYCTKAQILYRCFDFVIILRFYVVVGYLSDFLGGLLNFGCGLWYGFHIIGNASIKNVGKYQSCMVSKLPITWKRTRTSRLSCVLSSTSYITTQPRGTRIYAIRCGQRLRLGQWTIGYDGRSHSLADPGLRVYHLLIIIRSVSI